MLPVCNRCSSMPLSLSLFLPSFPLPLSLFSECCFALSTFSVSDPENRAVNQLLGRPTVTWLVVQTFLYLSLSRCGACYSCFLRVSLLYVSSSFCLDISMSDFKMIDVVVSPLFFYCKKFHNDHCCTTILAVATYFWKGRTGGVTAMEATIQAIPFHHGKLRQQLQT